MNFLLDTHTFLWCLSSPANLSKKAYEEIVKPSSNVYVSTITIWEIAIKQAVGKLKMPGNVEDQIKEKNFTPLPILIKHGLVIGALPLIHKDPFDRMLVAQAMEERLTIITRDKIIQQYKVKTLKA